MVEDQDFTSFLMFQERDIGATQVREVAFTLDAAKHIALASRTQKGAAHIECQSMVSTGVHSLGAGGRWGWPQSHQSAVT